MELKGSKTEKNLLAAFAGESQAYGKYQYYESKARKEGYEAIADIFTESAHNEHEHAKIWFKILHGGTVPATAENLSDAISGENYEHVTMYPGFAETAREEGFEKIAYLFESVSKIEQHHEERYKEALSQLRDGSLFKDTNKVTWICKNCGHMHFGTNAPSLCPVCAHPQSFFERD